MALTDLLEDTVDIKYYASAFIRQKRKQMHESKYYPSIWHENKSGNISSYPYSCALRVPDDFKIVVPDAQIRKQTGNAVPVNLVRAVLESLMPYILDRFTKNKEFYSEGNGEEFNVKENKTAFA